MPILVILRHGQSQWNLENRFTGNADIALTEAGRQEAAAAGNKLKHIVFDHAFTSLLGRAQETLDIILQIIGGSGIQVEKNASLNERSYGELQGLNKDETAGKYGALQVEQWCKWYDVTPPGGESLKRVAERIVRFYQQEVEPLLLAGKNVLLVGHGNSLRALMMYLENIDASQIVNVQLPTGVPRLYSLSTHLKLVDVLYL